MGDPLVKVKIPEGMPPAYQNALTENSKLVETLFFGVNASPPLTTESDRLQNLLHFLDVFIEIFNHSAKQLSSVSSVAARHCINTVVVVKGDSPVIRECITKYREYFRRHFRGVHYLSLAKLKEISGKAEVETFRSFRRLTSASGQKPEEENDLRRLLSLEQGWIDKINEERRKKDLEVIKTEAVENFRTKVCDVFPYLYSEVGSSTSTGNWNGNMKYCEENQLMWALRVLVNEAKASFKEQIPFRDQEDAKVISDLCSELEANLDERVIKDLKIRNSARKTVAQSYMDAMVENCVEKYKEAMTSCLEQEQQKAHLDMQRIYLEHQKLVEESRPKFANSENGMDIEVGSQEDQVRCWNNYGSRTYETFERIVKDANETAQGRLETCERESTEEVKNCLKRITEILGSYGLESFASGLQSHVMEGGLRSIFNHVKETNKVSSSALLQAAKPNTFLVKDEPYFESVMQSYKETYTERFVDCFRESKHLPQSLSENSGLLDKCHQDAKGHVSGMIQRECARQSHLESLLNAELSQFAERFVSHAKSNLKSFAIEVGDYEGTPVPFQAVLDTEAILCNGSKLQTRFQCVTMMPEYRNKSFEELQLEDRKHCRAIPLTAMMKLCGVPPTAFSELAGEFQRHLSVSSTTSPPLSIPQSSPPQCLFTFSPSPPSSSSQRRNVRRAVRSFNK